METTIGEYIGTTLGIHSPMPYSAPDSQGILSLFGVDFSRLGLRGSGLLLGQGRQSGRQW